MTNLASSTLTKKLTSDYINMPMLIPVPKMLN